jgi:hypothetical protein
VKNDDVEARFLANVASHEMRIIRADGVDRFIRFRSPERGTYWFDILTWPGCLCINGDVGCYVFSRIDDMFEFFRHPTGNEKLYINDGYWAEKLLAAADKGGRGAGVKRWSPEKFIQSVVEHLDAYLEDNVLDNPAQADELREAVKSRIIERSYDREDAMNAIETFEMHGLYFRDAWEWNCTKWDFSFLWCLYAIAWGIRKFDEAQPAKEIAA